MCEHIGGLSPTNWGLFLFSYLVGSRSSQWADQWLQVVFKFSHFTADVKQNAQLHVRPWTTSWIQLSHSSLFILFIFMYNQYKQNDGEALLSRLSENTRLCFDLWQQLRKKQKHRHFYESPAYDDDAYLLSVAALTWPPSKKGSYQIWLGWPSDASRIEPGFPDYESGVLATTLSGTKCQNIKGLRISLPPHTCQRKMWQDATKRKTTMLSWLNRSNVDQGEQ